MSDFRRPDPPRVLHVLESWRPVPSGYAARSWWIVTGQSLAEISEPAVLVTSRQSVYDDGPPERPPGIPLDVVEPSLSERRLRGWPAPFGRPFHVDGASLERAIVAAADRHKAELVHVHWSSAIGRGAEKAAARLGLPLVAEVRFDLAGAMGAQTFRGHAAAIERVVRRRFERHLEGASCVVAASDALAGLLRGAFPDIAARLHVVPNGVDAAFLARCDTARSAERGASSEGWPRQASADGAGRNTATGGATLAVRRPTLGTTSKMLRYENLGALVALCATRPALDLLFVGDGPERVSLERLAAPLNAERAGRVHFTGRLPAAEIPARLADMDLFVVPRTDLAITRYASPIKVVEAMAAARPIVATAVGDTCALLADGCGALVPPDEPAALGEAVDALVADPVGSAAIGERARARVVRDYEGSALLDRYRAVYERALGAAGSSG